MLLPKKLAAGGGEVAKYEFRWIFGVFFSEKMLFFGEKSPERVPPEVFYNFPFATLFYNFFGTLS